MSFLLSPLNFLYAFIVATYVHRTRGTNILFLDKLSKTYLLDIFRCNFFQAFTLA